MLSSSSSKSPSSSKSSSSSSSSSSSKSSKKRKEISSPNNEEEDEKQKNKKILVLAPSENKYKEPVIYKGQNAIDQVFNGVFNVKSINRGRTARDVFSVVDAQEAKGLQLKKTDPNCAISGCEIVQAPPFVDNRLFNIEENHSVPSNVMMGWGIPYNRDMTNRYVNEGVNMVSSTYRHPNISLGDTSPFTEAHTLIFPGIWASCGVPVSKKTKITDSKVDSDGNVSSFKLSHFLPEPAFEDTNAFTNFKEKLSRAREILIDKVDNAIETEAAKLPRGNTTPLLDFLKKTKVQFVKDQSDFKLEEHANTFTRDPDILKILKIVCEKTLERLSFYVSKDDDTFKKITKCVEDYGYIPRVKDKLFKGKITLHIPTEKGLNCLASASSMYIDLGASSRGVDAISAAASGRNPKAKGFFSLGQEPKGFKIDDKSKPTIVPVPPTLQMNIDTDTDDKFLALAYEMSFNKKDMLGINSNRQLEKELKKVIFSNDNPFLPKVIDPRQRYKMDELSSELVSRLKEFSQGAQSLAALRNRESPHKSPGGNKRTRKNKK
jgi:hypothetical protein